MSDWIRTKIGMQAMENIIRYLPRMTVALEEIAEEQKVKKIFYTEVENTKMSYVLTEDIAKVGKKLHEVNEFPSVQSLKSVKDEIITYGDKKLKDEYSHFGDDEEDMSVGASIVKSNEEVEGVLMSDGKIKHIDFSTKGE